MLLRKNKCKNCQCRKKNLKEKIEFFLIMSLTGYPLVPTKSVSPFSPAVWLARGNIYIGMDPFHFFKKQSFPYEHDDKKTINKMIVFKNISFLMKIVFEKRLFSKRLLFVFLKFKTSV